MSTTIYTTQLASDNFHRSNVSPLAYPWELDSYGDPGLEISSNVCQLSEDNTGCFQFYEYSGGNPNDQFAAATVAAWNTTYSILDVWVRFTDSGQSYANNAGYRFNVYHNGFWSVYTATGGLVLNGSGLTISPGDVFMIAVIGTTVYVFHNATELGSVTDATYSSGGTALDLTGFPLSATQVSEFTMGSASLTGDPAYDPTKTFLGFVRTVASAPAGNSNPFLGTYKVVSEAPDGSTQPGAQYKYLGTVVVGSPSGSQPNNFLGQVVEVASVPAGEKDTFLGTAETE